MFTLEQKVATIFPLHEDGDRANLPKKCVLCVCTSLSVQWVVHENFSHKKQEWVTSKTKMFCKIWNRSATR